MLSKEKEEDLSKYLSYILRHNPDKINLVLDCEGWASIDDLITKSKKKYCFTIEDLIQVVKNNNKQRFVFSEDRRKIKAQQGHSIKVDLNLSNVMPPKELYHGTATKFLKSIQKDGLKPMRRHDVHLSVDKNTAYNVGQRHGKVCILVIDAGKMSADGFVFQCTGNNVWLTQSVPVKYFKVLD